MPGIGHNQGPTMQAGHAWRRTAWEKSRKALLPRMPIEVIRSQINRAQELGLDYKTYASVRAASGRDVIAFLYSSNALRLHRSAQDLPPDRAMILRDQKQVKRLIAAHRPIDPGNLPQDFDHLHQIALTAADRAPLFTQSWSQMRDTLQTLSRAQKIPANGIVLIGETAFEHEWLAAGKFAGYIPADTLFAQASRPR